MRSVTTDLVHLFFTVPFYLVVLLAALAVRGWWRRDSVWNRLRYYLVVSTVVVYFVSVPALSNAMVGAIEDMYGVPTIAPSVKGDDTYIVVLSGGWFRAVQEGYEIKLGEASWERTDAAVALWMKVGGTLVFTGAPLPDGSNSVAQLMADLARRLGVPKDRILVEAHSRNTHENLLFTERDFHISQKPRVVVLTSALHMSRSVAIAERLGIHVIPYPCDFRADKRPTWQMWLPSNDAAAATEEVLHEIVGILAYRLRGWA
jgi:uncharacterized SAM-binding protein YcdF (DUF218 family)